MKIAGKLITETRKKGSRTIIEYIKPQSNSKCSPYIQEKLYTNGVKYTQKVLGNGKHLEVFEDNGKIYKVLANSRGKAIAINTLENGQKSKIRLFANTEYGNILAHFFDKTGEILGL